MKAPLVIIGAGGHAAVIAEALLCAGEDVLGFTDPDPKRHGLTVCALPVIGGDEVLETHLPRGVKLVNGIGGVRAGSARREVQVRLEARGWEFVAVQHPSAIVSRFARIGAATQLMAGCIVQAGATVAEGCIVNTGAVVEHDSTLGEFVHLATAALLCGGVSIGANSHVGAGAVVRQGVCLGEATTVGAGAVVVRDFAGRGVLVGIPARTLEASE